MKRKFNQFIRHLKNNPREAIFTILAFLLVGFFGYYAYSKFVVQNILSYQIGKNNKEISQIQDEINQYTGTDNYKKLTIGRYIQGQIKVRSWKVSIEKLVNIFDKFRSMSSGGLRLTDFKIDMDEIKMKGQVADISRMYGDSKNLTGGVIGDIEALDFISYINIPFYNKAADGLLYSFDLDAKINNNATIGTNTTATSGSQKNSGK